MVLCNIYGRITMTAKEALNLVKDDIEKVEQFLKDDIKTFTPEQLIEISMKELEDWANDLQELIFSFMYDTEIECDVLKTR